VGYVGAHLKALDILMRFPGSTYWSTEVVIRFNSSHSLAIGTMCTVWIIRSVKKIITLANAMFLLFNYHSSNGRLLGNFREVFHAKDADSSSEGIGVGAGEQLKLRITLL